MRFWKIFAWITFLFSLVFRRGKGIQVRKVGEADADGPDQQQGPGWRRVSSSKPGPYPSRRD